MTIVNAANYQLMKTESLTKAIWNYKQDDAELLGKLIENIKRNGQIENIIVRELPTGFFEVVNGNHRYDALKAMGVEEIMVYNLGANVSEPEAKRIAVETNETRFKTDNLELAKIVNELAGQFSLENLAETMPFSEDELVNYVKMTEFDWDALEEKQNDSKVDEDNTKVDGDEIKVVITPSLKHRWKQIKKSLEMNNQEAFEFAVVAAGDALDGKVEAPSEEPVF